MMRKAADRAVGTMNELYLKQFKELVDSEKCLFRKSEEYELESLEKILNADSQFRRIDEIDDYVNKMKRMLLLLNKKLMSIQCSELKKKYTHVSKQEFTHMMSGFSDIQGNLYKEAKKDMIIKIDSICHSTKVFSDILKLNVSDYLTQSSYLPHVLYNKIDILKDHVVSISLFLFKLQEIVFNKASNEKDSISSSNVKDLHMLVSKKNEHDDIIKEYNKRISDLEKDRDKMKQQIEKNEISSNTKINDLAKSEKAIIQELEKIKYNQAKIYQEIIIILEEHEKLKNNQDKKEQSNKLVNKKGTRSKNNNSFENLLNSVEKELKKGTKSKKKL